jgi:filamentous hemagglutinin family protein
MIFLSKSCLARLAGWWAGRLAGVAIILGTTSGISHGQGQVVLDGKFGSGKVAGPNFNITSQMGRTHGNNLFHSFSKFDIASGEIATFSGPANIRNILGRVTGGSPSSIDGTIRSDISGANVFLINPSGILFGPNASVDVSGSFAASSANYLKLADGARFVASLDADDSGLSSAPVSAFGFLGNNPGPITLDHATLSAADGATFSLIGGDIQFDGGTAKSAGGQIHLASVRSAGEVPADPVAQSTGDFKAAFAQPGQIRLENGAQLDASGEGGGRIVIRGGGLVVDNSTIKANTLGATAGQGIDLGLGGDLTIANGGQINSVSVGGDGAGGNISIEAGTVRLDGGGAVDEMFNPITQISTASGDPNLGGGSARGGDITINAERVELVNSAQISSTTYGAGDAGRIEINAGTVHLDAQFFTPTLITANTWLPNGGGNAGDIAIRANTVELVNGALLVATSAGSGAAGLVDITAETVNLRSGGIIAAGTFGSASGGNVLITAGTLSIDGHDSASGTDLTTGIQAVTTSATDPATGGNIEIHVDRLEMNHGATIFTTSYGLGSGGNINVSAGNVTLAHASNIRAEGLSYGSAGAIAIQAAARIELSSGSSINTSAPASSGGNIDVTAGSRLLLRNSQITASAGLDGGNINVSAPELIYLLRSTLTAEADSTGSGFGNGGNLTIDPSFLILDNSSLISRASFGNGGNIDILTDFFFQSASQIDASAPFGLPGTVSVTAPDVDLSGAFVSLPGDFVDVVSLLRPDCAVRQADNISSFIVLGQGGLPVQPGGFIPSGLVSPRVEAK